MELIYGCSECKPPRKVEGLFAFLYYVGTGLDQKHFDIEQQYFPPNAMLCRGHMEYLPEGLFIPQSAALKEYGALELMGLMQVDGRYQRSGLVITDIWAPSLLTAEKARVQFPAAMAQIDKRLREQHQATSPESAKDSPPNIH